MTAAPMACNISILVDGNFLHKHLNEFGEYVLSRPDKVYEIQLQNQLDYQAHAVVEVFVDGHSVLCPPRRTRVLRNTMRLRGFEKQRIDLPREDGTIEETFEFSPFVFTLPSIEEDRNHPELGLIRVQMYEPRPVEVTGRRRRDLVGESREPNVQPRQGKKANGPERMTTKEGDIQLTRPHALSRARSVHTVYNKGALIAEVELRYYKGEDLLNGSLRPLVGPRTRDGLFRPGHPRSSLSNGFGSNGLFSGAGMRLGGDISRQQALARLMNNAPGNGTIDSSSDNELQQALEETAGHDEEDLDLQRVLQLSMVHVSGAADISQASSSHEMPTTFASSAARGSAPAELSSVAPGSSGPTTCEEQSAPLLSSTGSSHRDEATDQLVSEGNQVTANTTSCHSTLMEVLADWDSIEWGEEYLSLQDGEQLHVQVDNDGQLFLDQGWAYAYSQRLASWGWYPPQYATAFENAE